MSLTRPAVATPCLSRPRQGAAACRAGMVLLAWTALAFSGMAPAATYKWVDDKGVVHYTDKMPPEAVNRGNVELSKDGVTLRRIDPALTPEQRRAREQEEERKRQLVRQQEETGRRDRALLASYASESEIDLARARALGTIDAVLQSTAAYTEQLTRRKVEISGKIAAFKSKPVPPVYERELESISAELERQADLVVQKQKEIVAVNARYDLDKYRYRELSAKGPVEGSPVAGSAAQGVGPRTATAEPPIRK
ncbi:MAG: DUF4124 domain-containing protein [Casimicrobiaceae bacterium]